MQIINLTVIVKCRLKKQTQKEISLNPKNYETSEKT